MIITRTPYRISFFGGGTDYRPWFHENGGAVLATTINRYCYISCRYLPPFFDHRNRIIWSEIEKVNSISEIKHPVVRDVLDYLQISEGVEIHHDGDLPARSGLGSSSAFTVGILHALYALKGSVATKEQLAREAIYIEQERLRENVGVQDQITTSYGGFNRVDIQPNGGFLVRPVPVSPERLQQLEDHLLLFYSGISRTASEIAGQKIAAIPTKQNELRTMMSMVDDAVDILANGRDIADFGRLLHESWMLKRSLTPQVAPAFVDEIYDKARRAGAFGGKLLGAGGGGFVLIFVRPEDRQRVLDALSSLLMVPIEFEQFGTSVIFHQHDRYSRTALSRHDFVR